MNNTRKFAALLITLMMLVSMTGCGGNNSKNTNDTLAAPVKTTESNKDETSLAENASINDITLEQTKNQADNSPDTSAAGTAEAFSMENTLFIGDSRAVGIMDYASIPADFFVSTGGSVFKIRKMELSVPNVGKVTLDELLDNKDYDRIYIMLGINDLGYPFESLTSKYKEFVDYLSEKKPDTPLIILANLPVSSARSQKGDYINNESIQRLNGELRHMADGKHIFYLDANEMFLDETGSLIADMTEDHVHPYGKYYAKWGKIIADKSAEIFNGNGDAK